MHPTVTGSRRGDLLVFALLLALILGLAGRLPVYSSLPKWVQPTQPAQTTSP